MNSHFVRRRGSTNRSGHRGIDERRLAAEQCSCYRFGGGFSNQCTTEPTRSPALCGINNQMYRSLYDGSAMIIWQALIAERNNLKIEYIKNRNLTWWNRRFKASFDKLKKKLKYVLPHPDYICLKPYMYMEKAD